MRSGTCPKCGETAVYRKQKGISLGEGGVHVYTGAISKATPLEHYVCAACGYFEAYLLDPAKLKAVAETWEKVG
jgi:predicted RNA-binding Zn-ribbon protein involved in translation (DUF1610 family)